MSGREQHVGQSVKPLIADEARLARLTAQLLGRMVFDAPIVSLTLGAYPLCHWMASTQQIVSPGFPIHNQSLLDCLEFEAASICTRGSGGVWKERHPARRISPNLAIQMFFMADEYDHGQFPILHANKLDFDWLSLYNLTMSSAVDWGWRPRSL